MRSMIVGAVRPAYVQTRATSGGKLLTKTRREANRKSRPAVKFVTSMSAGIGAGVGFPWSNSFDYNSDSVQYASDFALNATRFRFQEFLQLLEFGDQLFQLVCRIGSQS